MQFSHPVWRENFENLATPWRKWFAWRPIKITRTGQRVWLKQIYIRTSKIIWDENKNRWRYNELEYGDIFDILSRSNSATLPSPPPPRILRY